MIFKLPNNNYLRNNYTYTEVFITGYVWDLVVFEMMILGLFVVTFILKKYFAKGTINKKSIQKQALVSSNSEEHRKNSINLNKSSSSSSSREQQQQDNEQIIDEESADQQSFISQNASVAHRIIHLLNTFFFVLIWLDIVLIYLLVFSFGYFGYGFFIEFCSFLVVLIIMLVPNYLWYKIKINPKSPPLIRQPFFSAHNKVILSLFALWTLGSIFLIIATRGGCASGYNDKFGVYAGDQFYVSTAFSRSMKIDKVCPDYQVCHAYATLPQDTATAVFINAQTGMKVKKVKVSLVEERAQQFNENDDEGEVLFYQTSNKPYEVSNIESIGERLIHSVLFVGLQPDTLYHVTIQDVQNKKSIFSHKYRTLPSNYHNKHQQQNQQQDHQQNSQKQFRVVTGGDIGMTGKAQQLISHLDQYDPDVIVIGGDIVYDDAQRYCYYCWDNFYNMFEKLNDKLGRMVPLVMSVGNHDVGFEMLTTLNISYSEEQIPLFLLYNPQHYSKNIIEKNPPHDNTNYTVPQLSQRSVVHHHIIGPAIMFNLDSGYLTGFQSQVKEMELISQQYPQYYKFASFHNPIYPSCIDLDPVRNDYYVYRNATAYWVPVFDFYNFTAIFQHHTHHMKFSYKLINNTVVNQTEDLDHGTRYIGDGSWGVRQAQCDQVYLDNFKHLFQEYDVSSSSDHVWLVTLQESSDEKYTVNYTSINIKGQALVEKKQSLKPFNNKTQNVFF